MQNYFIGIPVAFLEPFFHAWCNIIDSYFSNKVFSKLSIFIFVGTVFNLIFLPFVILFTHPAMPPLWSVAILAGISLVEIFYIFPYYWAMRSTDASIVASLFSIGKIFIPVMAYFIVGEHLTNLQYTGFIVIIVAVTALDFDIKKLRFNKALFLMAGVSLVLSLEAVGYKYVFDQGISWGTVVTVCMIFEVLIAGILALAFNSRKDWKENVGLIVKNWKIAGVQQVFEWCGNACDTLAISLIPVSMSNGISELQPIFVLLYGVLFRKKLRRFEKERVSRDQDFKKAFFFSLIVIGTVLVI